MADVQQLIRQDGKRQLGVGLLFMIVALLFIVGVFFSLENMPIAILYAFVTGVTGISLLQAGWKDLRKATQTPRDFGVDDTTDQLPKLPARMYIGHEPSKYFEAKLYGMNGDIYNLVKEERQSQVLLVRGLAAMFSGAAFIPASYQMATEDGDPSYRLEKKGGMRFRGYVQHPNGTYVAYIQAFKDKTSGKSIYHYIEKGYCRWSAEGDLQIGHFMVKDAEGKAIAAIKRNAIPLEAVERFERIQGYLIEWEQRENIPYSLIAFLYLLQSRDRVH